MGPTSTKTSFQKIKLIICCDGTACSEYIQNPKSSLTNVSRFARAIRQSDENGIRQIVLYLPGIGTDEGNQWNWVNHATGKGLNNLILEAYTFLSHNWAVGDDIILLGFSRGAFAMRCLADFIMKNGIIPKGELETLHTRFAEWKTGKPTIIQASNMVPIKVCALWDTVSTMGLSDPTSRGPLWFVDSTLQPNIENAFQALSLHEHRYHFPPLVWKRGEATDNLEQCWFAGFHADIGGGDKDGVLAQFALVWFFVKLRRFLSLEDLVFGRDPTIEAWRTTTGEKLAVPDPSKWYYHLLAKFHHPFYRSSLFRRPLSQFRTRDGFEDGPYPSTDSTAEKIHSTLRFLDTNKAITRPALCVGVETLAGGNVNWKVSRTEGVHPHLSRPGHSAPGTNSYDVEQEDLDPYEKRLLSQWAEHQHNRLYDAPQLGAPPANTIVAALRAWLRT